MPFTRDELAAYEKGTLPPDAATQTTTVAAADKSTAETATEIDSTADGDASDTATQSDAGDTITSDEQSDTSTDGDSTVSTDSSDDDGSSDDSADSSTADADGSKGDKHEGDDSAVEPPRGSRARERIEELVAERNSLRKYGEHLLARIEELAKAKGVTTSSTEETPKGATKVDGDNDPAPTLEQFKFDQDKFARAQNEWIDRQVEKRVNAAVQGIETKREAAAVAAKFGELENAVRKVHKDYDIVVANPNLPALARGTAAQIVRSDFGPYITYHLAKNPDLATRIARQSQEQQLVSIGGLIAKFQTDMETAKAAVKTPPKPQVKKKTVTTAPPPGKRVQGGGTVQKNVGEMSMDEFVAYDRAQKLKEKQMRQQLRSSLAR